MDKTLFRQKTCEKMSTPDELTDYLKVTNPPAWMVINVVILLLAGLITWSIFGHLETTVDVKATVVSGVVTVMIDSKDAESVKNGMEIEIEGKTGKIGNVEKDEYGRTTATVKLDLEDGEYEGEITTESKTPISFLLD